MKGLFVQGILYRLHNVLIHAIVVFAMTGQWHAAIGTSVAFNLLNIVLYYHFHLWMDWIGRRKNGKDSVVDRTVWGWKDDGGEGDSKELELRNSGW